MPERLTFRLSPTDADNLAAVVNALRSHGSRPFADRSTTVKAALAAAAELAHAGLLMTALADASQRRRPASI